MTLTPEEARALDCSVAEKIMGAVRLPADEHHPERWRYNDQNYSGIPSYSTDIASAWEIVTTLESDGWTTCITSSELGGADVTFTCIPGARGRCYSEATTIPHAICLAALKAVRKGELSELEKEESV